MWAYMLGIHHLAWGLQGGRQGGTFEKSDNSRPLVTRSGTQHDSLRPCKTHASAHQTQFGHRQLSPYVCEITRDTGPRGAYMTRMGRQGSPAYGKNCVHVAHRAAPGLPCRHGLELPTRYSAYAWARN